MNRILMTSVRSDEEQAIRHYAEKNNVEIVISRDDFHLISILKYYLTSQKLTD